MPAARATQGECLLLAASMAARSRECAVRSATAPLLPLCRSPDRAPFVIADDDFARFLPPYLHELRSADIAILAVFRARAGQAHHDEAPLVYRSSSLPDVAYFKISAGRAPRREAGDFIAHGDWRCSRLIAGMSSRVDETDLAGSPRRFCHGASAAAGLASAPITSHYSRGQAPIDFFPGPDVVPHLGGLPGR